MRMHSKRKDHRGRERIKEKTLKRASKFENLKEYFFLIVLWALFVAIKN